MLMCKKYVEKKFVSELPHFCWNRFDNYTFFAANNLVIVIDNLDSQIWLQNFYIINFHQFGVLYSIWKTLQSIYYLLVSIEAFKIFENVLLEVLVKIWQG